MVSVVLAPMVAGSMFVILSRAGVEGGWWSANGDHGFPSKLRVSTRSTVWGHDPLPKGGPFESLRVSGDGVCGLGANGRRFHVCHPEPSGSRRRVVESRRGREGRGGGGTL